MNTLGMLRAVRSKEIEIMRVWRNTPSVRNNMYTRHEISYEEHQKWWEESEKRQDQEYFIYELDGAPRGVVSFTAIDKINLNCAWAFYAAPEAPRGSGSRMEFLALEYVFNGLLMKKLYCEVLAFNAPVIKMHEKFGFSVEGVFRQQHRVDDDLVDVYRLGMLREEWLNRCEAMHHKLLSQRRIK